MQTGRDSEPTQAVVTDRDRAVGRFDPAPLFQRERPDEVLVHLPDGGQVLVPARSLIAQRDGSYHVSFSFAGLPRYTEPQPQPEVPIAAVPHEEAAAPAPAVTTAHASEPVRPAPEPVRAGTQDETVVVPLVAEELVVGRQQVETGRVRVSTVVREHEQIVDEPILRDDVHVVRVPINQYIDAPVAVRYEGDTLVVPLVEEVLVVEKRLVLKEELRITKQRVEAREPQRVVLRSEEAMVERLPPAGAPAAAEAHRPHPESPVRE